MDSASIRQKMVDGQIRPSDVTDLRIIDAMNDIPREDFVAEKATAYLDIEADMGSSGRRMLKPYIVAKLLQAASIGTGDRVLVVGCGTGYTAAIVARLAAQVTGVESDPDLARRAVALTASAGAAVSIVTGPLPGGDPAGGQYDVIIVDGAVETGLQGLSRQLVDGGRLVGVLSGDAVSQAVLLSRAGNDCGQRALFNATGPVLPGFERKEAFVF